MLQCSFKTMVNNLTFVAVLALLGLVFIPSKSAVAEKGDHGVESVNKLKYADPVKDIHLYLCAFHVAKNNPKFENEDIESLHLKRVVHNQYAPQSRGY